MAKNGNNIIVYAKSGNNWVPIAGTRSDELEVSADSIEVSNADVGDWSDYIPGRKEWTLNVGWLIAVEGDIRKVLDVGTKYQLRIGKRTWDSSTGLTGYAILTSCRITATRGNLIQGSFQFQGCGSLS